MRNTRFFETQIIYAVEQAEMGISIRKIARKYAVCENTIYRWRRKYHEHTYMILGYLKLSELKPFVCCNLLK